MSIPSFANYTRCCAACHFVFFHLVEIYSGCSPYVTILGNMPEGYSALDQPQVLSVIFYPRKNVSVPPPGSTDCFIAVDKNTSVACRLYMHDSKSASILCFHGNAEVISDYDYIAPLYNQLGINLFVAEYRGYGASQGEPAFSTMISDASIIFESFIAILNQHHYSKRIFVMGRSLGSVSALEITCSHQKQIKGLIIESGFGSILKLLLHQDFPIGYLDFKDTEFPNVTNIRSVTIPTLILHGRADTLIPSSEAQLLFDNAASEDKRLVIIPKANHNDIMQVGLGWYLKAIKKFVYH